jgi:hypothetical protein
MRKRRDKTEKTERLQQRGGERERERERENEIKL